MIGTNRSTLECFDRNQFKIYAPTLGVEGDDAGDDRLTPLDEISRFGRGRISHRLRRQIAECPFGQYVTAVRGEVIDHSGDFGTKVMLGHKAQEIQGFVEFMGRRRASRRGGCCLFLALTRLIRWG